MIPETVKISSERTTSAKSINLDIITEPIEYCEYNTYSHRFRDIAVRR